MIIIIIYSISILFFIALFCIIPHVFDLARYSELGEKLLNGDIWAFLFILVISFIPVARIAILCELYDIIF